MIKCVRLWFMGVISSYLAGEQQVSGQEHTSRRSVYWFVVVVALPLLIFCFIMLPLFLHRRRLSYSLLCCHCSSSLSLSRRLCCYVVVAVVETTTILDLTPVFIHLLKWGATTWHLANILWISKILSKSQTNAFSTSTNYEFLTNRIAWTSTWDNPNFQILHFWRV